MRNTLLFGFLCLPLWLSAQQNLPLTDMSFWQQKGKTNWQIVGDVFAEMDKHEVLTTVAGTGILANQPTPENRANLLSIAEYGDVDVSFDFMMANHSNSGFYLMGRYEVQLLDSWGVKMPNSGDCGGIYKRRRYTADKKEILYEGHAPRQNACFAPGLWQHLDISFQAPRFDANGKKTMNAKMLKVVLNGVIVQENLALTGPTGGPISETEAARGPFLIQGDHGPVAFRNFKITDFKGVAPALNPIDFKVYYGVFRGTQSFLKKLPDTTGVVTQFDWQVSKEKSDFAQVFNTTLNIPKADTYTFTLKAAGNAVLKINGKEVLPEAKQYARDNRTINVALTAGQAALEIVVYKNEAWVQPILGLWINGTDFRPVAYHNFASLLAGAPHDPIIMDAKENTVFRSFMDIEKNNTSRRIVHGVNVGSPDKLHYTFDMDKGALVQIWKGNFLNAAPMWDDRGDGSSTPLGARLILGNTPNIVTETSKNDLTDTVYMEANYTTLGYILDEAGVPTFRYKMYGSEVTDMTRNTEGGKFITRTVAVNNPMSGLSFRLAIAKDIVKVTEETYIIDGKQYYLKLLNGAKATIEKVGDNVILVTPLKDKVQYAIMW